jgi:hypothetical protein
MEVQEVFFVMKTAYKEEGEKEESDLKEEEKEKNCRKKIPSRFFRCRRKFNGILSTKKTTNWEDPKKQ